MSASIDPQTAAPRHPQYSQYSQYSVSICVPVYKGSRILKKSIDSILKQGFPFHEILFGDDNPPELPGLPELKEEIENTRRLIESYNDPRLKHFKNETNLGYAVNLQRLVAKATGDIIFLMAQDDVLSNDSLAKTHDAFLLDDDVGVVTRPYFWFMNHDIKTPVRVVTPPDATRDLIFNSHESEYLFNKVFESVGQLSGLAYRRQFIEVPFHEECFPAHIYPFAGIFRKHKCVFLKDYTVAVGIEDSQTRSVSSIYDLSPTESWVNMFKSVFKGVEYSRQREWGISHIASNHIGLLQIKNFGNPGTLTREIKLLLKYRPKNFIDPKFYFFAMGCLVIPKRLLVPLIDRFKKTVSGPRHHEVHFNE